MDKQELRREILIQQGNVACLFRLGNIALSILNIQEIVMKTIVRFFLSYYQTWDWHDKIDPPSVHIIRRKKNNTLVYSSLTILMDDRRRARFPDAWIKDNQSLLRYAFASVWQHGKVSFKPIVNTEFADFVIDQFDHDNFIKDEDYFVL
jgi:hypothetical protein